jgi:hypothetical protein
MPISIPFLVAHLPRRRHGNGSRTATFGSVAVRGALILGWVEDLAVERRVRVVDDEYRKSESFGDTLVLHLSRTPSRLAA